MAQAQFALVSFATDSQLDAGLSAGSVIETAIDNLAYSGGWTNTEDALYDCKNELEGADPSHDKYIFIITDGNPTKSRSYGPYSECDSCKRHAKSMATSIKNSGIDIVSVGLETVSSDPDLLRDIASSPSYFFTVSDYDLLESQVATIAQAANNCQAP